MYRALIVATLFLTASVSFAGKPAPQPPPPPPSNYVPAIAYTMVASRTNSLYLANQDGSNAISVYSSSRAISDIDFAPGGGKVAFSDGGTLKVLSYSASPSAVVVNSVITLDINAGYPDFSPDGSKIIYVGQSAVQREVRIISSSGGIPHSVMYESGWAPAYLHSGDRFVHFKRNSSNLAYEIEEVILDANDNVSSVSTVLSTSSQIFKGIEDIDTARTKDSVLITANFPTEIRLIELDLSSNSLIDHVAGFRGHFSSDDSKIISTDSSTDQIYKYDVTSHVNVKLTNTNAKQVNYSSTDFMP